MILNAYAVLDAFLVGLRLVVAVLVTGLAWTAWWHCGKSAAPESRRSIEDRFYLLFLLAILLAGLNVASWPTLYLLLQSYVPEWPGVMCIYGVTQVGTGSLGTARFLPPLLTTLQVAKPLLVFVTGVWFVLYLVNRRTATAPLTRRVLAALIWLGLLAVADSAAEAAYLVIPKKEEFLSVGCCTAAFASASLASRLLPEGAVPEDLRSWLWVACYTGYAATMLVLSACALPLRRRGRTSWLLASGLAAVVLVPVVLAFLIEIAAPTLLRLPFHHCLYDLVPNAPESVVAMGLFVLGTFSVGWACLAAWCGQCDETQAFLPEWVRSLVLLALYGYVGSVTMLSIELALV